MKKVFINIILSFVIVVSIINAIIAEDLLQKKGIGNDKITEIIDEGKEKLLSQAAAEKNKPADDKKDDKKNPEKKKEVTAGLKPLVIKGTKEKDWKKREIQSISRQTMTSDDMKEVPASFGDSVSALTALPGIIRPFGGFFGPLVIRGADFQTNNYYIDDIPIQDPMHFGGLHSVINTNLMKDVDVYASAFPVEFGSATSAIINITTIDDVTEFGGYTDIGLLSASALVKTAILRDKFGRIIFDSPSHPEQNNELENAGYTIVSGRYGWIYLGIKAADLITGSETPISPEYWDYQFKTKYIFNKAHSATLFLFGHRDFFRLLLNDTLLEEGDDPLLQGAKFRYNVMSHNQGLYFDSKITRDFSNRLLYFSSLPDKYFYLDFGAQGTASWAKDINYHVKPWIFGLKDKAKIKWMDGISELRGSAGYTLYYFRAKGRTIIPTGVQEDINLGDEDSFRGYPLDVNIKNHMFSAYLENKMMWNNFTVLPGIRSDYFSRAEAATCDPRIMLSYKFPTDTTLSAAAGHYSYFFQTNPFYFENNPDLAGFGKIKKPEQAKHFVLGAEQEFDLYTVKIEGFRNYFYNKPQPYDHTDENGKRIPGLLSGKQKTYGFEVMVRKDTKENHDGLFGWFSYTFTRSKVKTGLPTQDGYLGIPTNKAGDPYGDRWTLSEFEQRHCLKLIAGYRLSNHTISSKFQYYSSFPYTPIIDGTKDTNYPGPGERYAPVYGGRNSKHYPPYYQLDMRYTYKINHTWGYVSWYVEMINVFMKKEKEVKWYYNSDYSEGNNPRVKNVEGFAFLPNFGVEVKF